jgi:hypothetical protein
MFDIPVFFPGRGLVCSFSLAAPKKLHHSVFPNSYPGTPYYHRTGCPAVSPGQTQTDLTELVRTPNLSYSNFFLCASYSALPGAPYG